VIAALAERLSGDAHELADPYAEAVLAVARAAAGGHPTPQSRMAASGLRAERGSILSPPGVLVSGRGGHPVPLSAIVGSAEWGSGTYRQFAPRNVRGYWLIPSSESGEARSAGDRALAEILAAVVR
jgi:hypothetical protein